MHYLIFFKKTVKNIHGCFIEGPAEDLSQVVTDLERYSQLDPGDCQWIEVNKLKTYQGYKHNICYYRLDDNTYIVIAAPEVNDKSIKEIKRHLKSEYGVDKIEIQRLLPIHNWGPTTPFKLCLNQKLIKNVEASYLRTKRKL